MTPAVTLGQASALVDAALARGAELGLALLTVTVLDPGGHTAAGQAVGAAGISGDTSDNDEACAIHGAHAAGLVPWLE